MPVVFRDVEGKRLDSDGEVLEEITSGRKVKRTEKKEERVIYPNHIVFLECKTCRTPLAEILREMTSRVLVRCIRCYSPDIVKKIDMKMAYTPKNLKKSKAAKSKASSKEIEAGA